MLQFLVVVSKVEFNYLNIIHNLKFETGNSNHVVSFQNIKIAINVTMILNVKGIKN